MDKDNGRSLRETACYIVSQHLTIRSLCWLNSHLTLTYFITVVVITTNLFTTVCELPPTRAHNVFYFYCVQFNNRAFCITCMLICPQAETCVCREAWRRCVTGLSWSVCETVALVSGPCSDSFVSTTFITPLLYKGRGLLCPAPVVCVDLPVSCQPTDNIV